MAWRRSKYDAGPVEETASFVAQDWVGVLSVPVAVVSSDTSTSCARTMLYPTRPASSRSEFVMVPDGLSHDTSREETSSGKG
jgi:hypothetical protein